MAEVILNVVKFGSAPAWTVINATDTFLMSNDGLTKLYVENTGGSAIAATFIEQRACNYGHALTNFVFSCGAGATSVIGTFRKDRYNRADGRIAVTFSIPGGGTNRAYGVYDVPEDGRI